MATQLGNALNSLSNPSQNGLVGVANDQVLDFHAALEDFAHDSPLNSTIHGVTDTGETIGLGKVGDTNIITDVEQAPGDILNGANPGTVVSGIVTDAGNVVAHAGGIISGLGTDLSNPDFVPDLTNGATSIVNDLSGALPGDGLGDLGHVGDLGGLLNGGLGNGGNGNSGEPVISIGAGNNSGTPILDLGVLTAAPGDSPIGIAIGSGTNLADVNLLSGEGSHLISAEGGAAGGNSLLDAGLLTTPDGQFQINADVANATNILNASLLPHSDLLSFPDLGGAGTDALTGIVPSTLGALDLGAVAGATNPASTTQDAALVDVHTDGSALVHINPEPNALVGTNDHAIV